MRLSRQALRMQERLLPAVVGLGIAVALAGPAALVLIAWKGPERLEALDAYSLPILLIGGIVMFLVALCVVVIVFQRLGLASTNYALGLPEGSIRAFIALALILLFFMMGVYLYTGISEQDGEVIAGLTVQEAAAIPDERVAFRVTRDGVVDVHLNPASAAGEDVARQMITTMSTLVVAIAAFYFGTSSVQQAFATTGAGAGGSGSGSPSLVRLEPRNSPRALRRKGDGWEPETVRLKSSPPDVWVEGSIEGDESSSLVAVDDSGAYTYTPVQPSPDGVTLRFRLAGHRDVTDTLSYLVPGAGGGAGGGGGEDSPPAVDEPGGEQPVAEQPVIEQPVVEQPVVEQPVVELPVVEQPEVEQPVEEEPEDERPGR